MMKCHQIIMVISILFFMALFRQDIFVLLCLLVVVGMVDLQNYAFLHSKL